jgi:hypothetical protein
MHKNAMKCNETLSKWCKNKHGASKIIDTLETYQVDTRKLVGKPQEKVMMSTAASFPSVVKPRFIEPLGERTKLPKVDAR